MMVVAILILANGTGQVLMTITSHQIWSEMSIEAIKSYRFEIRTRKSKVVGNQSENL
jgi:hypothetical protein